VLAMSKRLALALLTLPSLACADFTYDSTNTITGGSLVGIIKMAGAFSKDARKALDPIPSTVSVKGNRMIHRTADLTQIIDLDKETITSVDAAKHTYSVMTFAEMKQAMDDMAKKMGQRGGGADPNDMKFNLKTRETGQKRTISGVNAREVIMTMTVEGQDAKSGQKGGLDVTQDMWISPDIAGYAEAREFQQKMSRKLAWAPGGNAMLNRPDVQRAMAEMAKNGGALDGMVMLTNIQMGGALEGMPPTATTDAPRPQRTESAAPPTSMSDALGAAMAGRLGGLGRRKPQQPANDAPTSTDTGNASGNLVEMTMQVTHYTSAPADPSLFEIPAGFKQVQENPLGQRRR